MLLLYENIRKRRIDLGISQQELAEMVGYKGKSMISQVESGNVDLSLSMIERFAEALKTTSSDLMGWDEWEDNTPSENTPSFTVNPHDRIVLSTDELQIIQKLREMPQHERDFCARMILYYDRLKDIGDDNANR